MIGHKVLEERQVLFGLRVVALHEYPGDSFNLLEGVVLRRALLEILRLSVRRYKLIRLLGHAALLMTLSVSVLLIHVVEVVRLAFPLFHGLVVLRTLPYVRCGHTLSNKRHSIFLRWYGLVCRQSMNEGVCSLNLSRKGCLIKRLVWLDWLLLCNSLWRRLCQLGLTSLMYI